MNEQPSSRRSQRVAWSGMALILVGAALLAVGLESWEVISGGLGTVGAVAAAAAIVIGFGLLTWTMRRRITS